VVVQRIPALALSSLAGSARDMAFTPTLQQRTALAAIRNGIEREGKGSAVSFAERRLDKLTAWADRANTAGVAAAALHKSPFKGFIQHGSLGVHENVIKAFRRTSDAASIGADLAARLAQQQGPSLSEPARVEAFGTAALMAHWSKRFILTQQIVAGVDSTEAEAMARHAADLAGRAGDTAFVASVQAWAGAQSLDRDFLQRCQAQIHEQAERMSPPPLDRRALQRDLRRLDDAVAEATGLAAQIDQRAAADAPQWGAGAAATGKAARAARRQDPVGALADAVRSLELGSVVTVSGGRKASITDPVATGMAIGRLVGLVPSAADASLGPSASGARRATIRASISTPCAEIFVGTENRTKAQVVAGVGVKFGLAEDVSLMRAGVKAALGMDHARQMGVYLRFQRDGSVPTEASAADGARPVGAPAGVTGDDQVAARMAQVIETIRELNAKGEENVLLSLLIRFPELSVSIGDQPDSAYQKSNWETSASADLMFGLEVKDDVVLAAPALKLEGEVKPRQHARTEPAGGVLHTTRSSQGYAAAVRAGASVGVAPAPSGIAEAGGTLLRAGKTTATTVLKADGRHQVTSIATIDFETFKGMEADVREHMAEYVAGSLSKDPRAAGLMARHAAAQPDRHQALEADAAAQRAAKFEAFLANTRPGSLQSYQSFLIMHSATAARLDELDTLRQLSGSTPALAALREQAEAQYDQLAGDLQAYQRTYALTLTKRQKATERALPLPVSYAKERFVSSSLPSDLA
jgi:hypothetical protein